MLNLLELQVEVHLQLKGHNSSYNMAIQQTIGFHSKDCPAKKNVLRV